MPDTTPPPRVVVDGRGPVPDGIAALLRHLGVARVEAGGYAAAAAEAATDPAAHLGPERRPHLVVLTATPLVPAAAGRPWLARGIPHLPIACEHGRATLGPLVLPGHSACLTCQDLTRTDLDPRWAAAAARAAAGPALSPATVDAGALITPLVVALAGLVVAGWVDGAAPTAGVSTEVSLPWPTVVHRHWPVHPGCGCAEAAGAPAAMAPSAGTRGVQDTMAR